MQLRTLAVLAFAGALVAGPASARDQIRIVGSSTVFPFATSVAEQFGKTTAFKTPVIESTGSGGGLKLFCSGVGTDTPDVTNSSRRIKESEVELCAQNGVTDIVEVKIGFDGIVIANSKKAGRYDLTKEWVFRALAKEVPIQGKMVPNPYKKWSDIDGSLPDTKIEVLGPPPTSGTRDAFVELAMEGGAKAIPMLAELRGKDKKAFKAVAHAIREDGALRRGGGERQPDRPEARGQPGCARRVRLLVPRPERRQDPGQPGGRRGAHLREHRGRATTASRARSTST